MSKKRRQFYVPNVDFWVWERITDTFLKVQLERCRDSILQTESALNTLDEAVNELQRIVFKEYRTGNTRLKETVETAYAEIRDESKRIIRVQDKLVQVTDRIKAELQFRKINTDRKLPA